MVKPRSPWRLILFALCLAAFALRAFNLAQQSLWYDEAFSLFLARMGLGEMVARTAADIQPPFYYFLLHFWTGLAGESEFAARFLSLFFGVLTIPLLYAIARRALTPERAPAPPGGTAVLRAAKRTRAPREAAPVPAPVHWSPGTITGLLAALLAVVSPLYLWYSQEARMYTLITFLLLLSSYCLLRALDHARRAWWVSFALANIAAVYTHYFAFVLIVFQFLYYLWRALPKARAGLRAALVSFAAIVVSFLPWLPFLLNRLGEDVSYWRGPLKLDEALRHIAINFTMGESVLEAMGIIEVGEPVERWCIFRTNQGTDAHLARRYQVSELKSRHPSVVTGIVEGKRRIIEGGHVIFTVTDGSGRLDCAAYEPSGGFRDTVNRLREGDEVRVAGGVRETEMGLTLNLERLEVVSLAVESRRVNPKCPMCGGATESMGKGQGLRCKRCGFRGETLTKVVEEVPRDISPGVYLPPPRAERHLTKPLKRYGMENSGAPKRLVAGWHSG